MLVKVDDGKNPGGVKDIERPLRYLKKKLQREGIFREMKIRRFYEKPSEKRIRERSESLRRSRKSSRRLFDFN